MDTVISSQTEGRYVARCSDAKLTANVLIIDLDSGGVVLNLTAWDNTTDFTRDFSVFKTFDSRDEAESAIAEMFDDYEDYPGELCDLGPIAVGGRRCAISQEWKDGRTKILGEISGPDYFFIKMTHEDKQHYMHEDLSWVKNFLIRIHGHFTKADK